MGNGAETTVYIGTYTDDKREGIHILAADPANGALAVREIVHGVENPTYLALDSRRRRLYTVQGVPQYGARDRYGAVAVYGLESGAPQLLDRRPVGVTVPCHISLSPDERLLAFAEYTNAVAGVFALNDDGTFAPGEPYTVKHHGSGPDRERQEAAHAHCAVFTPGGSHLCIADMGIDRVAVYDVCVSRGGGLRENTLMSVASAGGAGPRHLLFHPNGRLAFLLHELDNTITVLRYTDDGFSPLQTISTIPTGFNGVSAAAALKLTADGRRLLASNRGHDSIAVFAVTPENGHLELMAISALAGSFPRDFALFPGEAFVLVGHERSHGVASYAFDYGSGVLSFTGAACRMHRPVCVVFA